MTGYTVATGASRSQLRPLLYLGIFGAVYRMSTMFKGLKNAQGGEQMGRTGYEPM